MPLPSSVHCTCIPGDRMAGWGESGQGVATEGA